MTGVSQVPYDPRCYPPFAVAVDLVVLTVRQDRLAVLVVRRGVPPYRGRWALPGGFVAAGESLDAAARRELREETGLAERVHLEQLYTYGAPRRDPRMRVVAVAYLCLLPRAAEPTAGGDAAASRWSAVDDVGRRALAFDHRDILRDGVERARAKLEYTPVAAAFCPPEFTVADLRRVYEAVWGTPLDGRNFHRKVTGTPGFLVPTGRSAAHPEGGRPARLYVRGTRETLHPPMLRGHP